MSDSFTLGWAILTLSLANVILLGWLGLTVLLNADRPRWGIWLTSGALLSGSVFFMLHTGAMLAGLRLVNPSFLGEWPVVWVLGFLLPCAWYLVMLWHVGFWEGVRALRAYSRHVVFLVLLALVMVLGIATVLLTPISWTSPYPIAVILGGPMLGNLSTVTLAYSALLVLCTAFSLDALVHPAPSARVMLDLARRRARPWLSAASLCLLAVSIVLGLALCRFTPYLFQHPLGRLPAELAREMAWADLGICALITAAVLLLGQAIVAYEIFTGKTLPRRGLRRNWRRTVVLAAGFSTLISAILNLRVPAIFGAMLATVIVTFFYAFYNWRSHVEHEHAMERLRPFVTGPSVYDALLATDTPEPQNRTPFGALCAQLLGVERAVLLARGPFAALVEPLVYPPGAPPPDVAALSPHDPSPLTLCLPLEPSRADGLAWAVPLWSTHGYVGVLLLSGKRDDGLFTQEEMEMARAAGERMLDTLASTELAHRLMRVQRARLAESQVVDRRTRRTIHDDILPQLHTTMLTLSGLTGTADALEQLTQVHRRLSDVLHAMPSAVPADLVRAGVMGALRAALAADFDGAFDTVAWEVAPDAEARFAALPPLAAEVLFAAAREAIRNAARYARADRPLTLTLTATADDTLMLTIADNGRGLAHGTPTTGAGQGMLLHGTMMAVVGGAWTTDSAPDVGTRVLLTLPA